MENDLLPESFYGLRKPRKGKWETESEATRRLTVSVGVRQFGPTSFNASIATPKDIQLAVKLGVDDPSNPIKEWRITHCRRLVDSSEFYNDDLTPPRMLSSSMQTVPVDKCFSMIFAGEKLANERIGLKRPGVSETKRMEILEALADKGPSGILSRCKQADATRLLQPGSPLHQVPQFYLTIGTDNRALLVRGQRASALRFDGDMKLRHDVIWNEDPMSVFITTKMTQVDR